MTLGYGLGLLTCGFIAMLIIVVLGLRIINKKGDEK
jgi:hypothetical protein